MECNLTSCANRNRRSGFTIAEFLVASTIALLAIGATLVLWAYAGKTCATLAGYVELSNSSKIALDRVSQLIRNAKTVQSCSATQLVLIGIEGATNAVTFNAAAKTLTATTTNGTKTLLTECTNFEFIVYQRTPLSNSMDLNTNGFATKTAKVIEMRWTCKRSVTGDKDVLETLASSKVVMRNP